MPDRAVAVDLAIAAPLQTVWHALPDPDAIRRWHGWEYDGIAQEIDAIYVQGVEADETAGTVALGDGSRFGLDRAAAAATRLRLTMPAPAASWDASMPRAAARWSAHAAS